MCVTSNSAFSSTAPISTHICSGRSSFTGEFSIADIALYPVVLARAALIEGTAGLVNLKAWQQRVAGREQTVSAMAANG